ncbi:MAG: gliding motility lipoprotein GldB, partial [Bacteroidota bacterium]
GKLADMKAYLENPRNITFQAAVASQYKDGRWIENGLTEAFKHYRYYYPGVKIPRVYAYISGGDYDFPVQFADSVMLIGLDNFLGRDFKPYAADGLPFYRITRMNSGNILPECMKVLLNVTYREQLSGNTLLEQMVEAGKRLFFIDAMIPGTDDRFKIGFTQPQQDWIVKNEAHVWAAIIENRMLYTTDGKLIRAFMSDGPFTAEFSKDSPSRLGEWLGWQIVRNYMENQPEVTLSDLMNEKDAQKILAQSGYKPEKQ